MLTNKRVLVTGGAGFIGKQLCRSLKQNGAQVIVIDKLSPQIHGDGGTFNLPGVEFIQADVTMYDVMLKAVSDVDYIVHLAAETGTGQSMYEMSRYVQVNEFGTAVMLQAILDANVKPKIVLASSRSVYGEGSYIDTTGAIFTPNARSASNLKQKIWEHLSGSGEVLQCVATKEDAKLQPGSIYAATKLNQENLIKTFATTHNISATILRLQNVYGEEQSLRNPYTGIISIFYNRIRQGLPIEIFEDGLESRDFVHRDDVINAINLSLTNEKNDVNILNIGSGKQTSVLNLAHQMLAVANLQDSINIVEKYRIGDIRHNYADIRLAQSTIGYKPNVTLEAGLKRFVNWAENEPIYIDKTSQAMKELAAYGLAND